MTRDVASVRQTVGDDAQFFPLFSSMLLLSLFLPRVTLSNERRFGREIVFSLSLAPSFYFSKQTSSLPTPRN